MRPWLPGWWTCPNQGRGPCWLLPCSWCRDHLRARGGDARPGFGARAIYEATRLPATCLVWSCVSTGSQLGCGPQSYRAAALPGSRTMASVMVGAPKMPHGR